MNKVILIGRLTKDPETRYSQGQNSTCISRYSLAVDRQFKRDGEQIADFLNCVAFGKQGEFAEKYLKKGTKIAVTGRLQTGSYTDRDGKKVYTTDVVVESHEFVESKKEGDQETQSSPYGSVGTDGFMNIPDGIDEELPFS